MKDAKIKMQFKPGKVYYQVETGSNIKCCVVYDKWTKEYRLKIGLEKPRMTKVVFNDLLDALDYAQEAIGEFRLND